MLLHLRFTTRYRSRSLVSLPGATYLLRYKTPKSWTILELCWGQTSCTSPIHQLASTHFHIPEVTLQHYFLPLPSFDRFCLSVYFFYLLLFWPRLLGYLQVFACLCKPFSPNLHTINVSICPRRLKQILKCFLKWDSVTCSIRRHIIKTSEQ